MRWVVPPGSPLPSLPARPVQWEAVRASAGGGLRSRWASAGSVGLLLGEGELLLATLCNAGLGRRVVLCRRGALDARDLLHLVAQAALGVDAAHVARAEELREGLRREPDLARG